MLWVSNFIIFFALDFTLFKSVFFQVWRTLEETTKETCKRNEQEATTENEIYDRLFGLVYWEWPLRHVTIFQQCNKLLRNFDEEKVQCEKLVVGIQDHILPHIFFAISIIVFQLNFFIF